MAMAFVMMTSTFPNVIMMDKTAVGIMSYITFAKNADVTTLDVKKTPLVEMIGCVILYYMFRFLFPEKDTNATTTPSSSTQGPESGSTVGLDGSKNISYCIRPQWVGDGECDPVCNTPWCNFDDGDCEGAILDFLGFERISRDFSFQT